MRRLLLSVVPVSVILLIAYVATGPFAASTVLLGNTAVATLNDNDSSGSAEAFKETAAASGNAATVSVYVSAGSAATGLQAGLYADSGGHPGALLASGSTSAPASGQWNQLTLGANPAVVSGGAYWIAILGTGGRLNFRDQNGSSSCSQNSKQTTLTSLPSTWTSGRSWTSCSLSAYVVAASVSPPSNTGLPLITGTTTQGESLAASNGSWSGSPTSYAYQWQDCDTDGANCSAVAGATGASYVLASTDVGDTIRVVVTATNSGGTASATSAQTATVITGDGSGTVPCALTHAAGADGTNSCWATHTGVQNGTGFTEAQIVAGQSTLTHVVGDQKITTPGAVISNEWISGCVAISASNVTIKNSLITPNGDNCSGGSGGTQASAVNDGATGPGGTLVEDVTVDGHNSVGDQYGMSLNNAECLRCNVFGFEKNYYAGSSTLFQDSYSHDITVNGQCSHADGMFIESSSNVTIEHSYTIMSGITDGCINGAIDSGGSWGPVDHETIDSSYMEGTVDGEDWHGECATPNNVVVTNDAFSSSEKGSGPWIASAPGNVWSGNYVAESPSTVYPAPSGC
jgi:hypothetical protein